MATNRTIQTVRLVDFFNNTNKFIDPLTSWKVLGIYRLAAVVHILRKDGFNIVTHNKTVKNKWNENVTFANYEFKNAPVTWKV